MMQRGFLKSADWLDAARAGAWLRLVALVQAATLIWLVATSSAGVDSNGYLIGSDFLSFWTSGAMLVSEATPYDVAAHIARQRAFFSQDGYVAFFYPPPFLLACYPLGLLPYFPALAAWLAATGAAFLAAVRLWQREFLPARAVGLLAAAFPPTWLTITHGQTSFLAAALIGAGMLLVVRRPWLAGCLIGLAIFKPQYGLLIPFVLLATRQWSTILAASTTALALALLTALAFGPQVWLDWYAVTTEAGNTITNNAVGYGKMVSVTAGAMLLGVPAAVATGLQLLVSLGIAGALMVAGWQRGYSPALAAAMLAGTPLVTPFVLDYDLTVIAFPLIWLASREHLPWERIVVALAFAAPLFARPLALNLGVPVMVPVLALLFVLLLRRALAANAEAQA